MKNKNFSIVLLILLSTTLGCRLITNLMIKQSQNDFFEGDSAQKAANAVKSKVGFPCKVQEVEITENSFKMKIEAPGNSQNVDEYTYLGSFVAGPEPVQLNGFTRTLDKLPFDEIDFAVIPQIVKNALEKMQIEDGVVTKMRFGTTHFENKFGWDVQIQGTRESASAQADITGNIVSVNLSQTNRAANYKVLNETELTKATDAIKAKFGENAQVDKISIRGNSISLKVINPENSKMYDAYEFGVSGLQKSPPPPLPADIAVKQFAFNRVNLLDAVNLAQKTKEKLAMTDGQVSYITIGYGNNPEIRESNQLIWTVAIEKGINSGYVEYDDKLRILVRKH